MILVDISYIAKHLFSTVGKNRSGNRLTLYIGIALVLGVALGFVFNKFYVGSENRQIAVLDTQLEMINSRMNQAIQPVNPRVFEKNNIAITSLEKKIGELESDLVRTGKTYILDSLSIIRSQIRVLKSEQSKLIDTSSTDYKRLKESRDDLVRLKKNAVISQDKKLEPFSLMADVFIRLIKMIVAPLVFTTLTVGVAKLGDIRSVGRIGGKTLLWFISASLISLVLGMILVNLFKPGSAMNLPLPESSVNTGVDRAALTLRDFINHLAPESFIQSMAKNEILQIVVFSLIFGIAAASLGKIATPVVKALDVVAHIILKVTGYVMGFAPIAVFGAMVAIIAKQGLGILGTYSIFIGEFYLGLLLLWMVLIFAGSIFIKKRIFHLIQRIKEPALVAFSTSSSEAAFPQTMIELERFGCNERIVSFVLPLGYSFNLDGSMMYMTFASIFIAQSFGINLDFGTQISMLLVLMLTSKGIAGVPRASLVVIAGTLATFNIPEAGIALLLGIDPLLDMGRSVTNILGNSVATAVVSKWEGQLEHAS